MECQKHSVVKTIMFITNCTRKEGKTVTLIIEITFKSYGGRQLKT